MHRFRKFVPCLCAVLSLSAHIFAQNFATAVTGQVLDHSGAAVVGAHIEAKQLDGSSNSNFVSDQEGRFSIRNLPAGRYRIHVDHAGFRDAEQEIQIETGTNAPLNLTLDVSSLAETVTVNAQSPAVTESPAGQTQTSISREDFKNTPAFTIGQLLDLTPGVTIKQGNGPRDISISIRGSNDRQTFAIRNIQIFEDGFPVTQPDGTSRTDLIDPHAYSRIDVVEGPSSALYGNYATGGAINFHTRSGGDVQGIELGTDVGSFGYLNNYITAGNQGEHYQYTVFASNVRAKQYTQHSAFNTITANLLATYEFTPKDRVTFKFIDNDLDTALSVRLSLNQYLANPYQKGCANLIAAGCGSVSLFTNGFNGAKQSLSADQAGLGRHDRRTVVGARWEHDLSSDTTWRTQFVFDDRNISQPTSSTSAVGPTPSFNVMSDVAHHGTLWGHQSTSYAGVFFNSEDINSYTYNLTPAGNASLGGVTQAIFGQHLNTGLRGREEFRFDEKWMGIVGLGAEYTNLTAQETNYSYPESAAPVLTHISADRTFFNVAPEVSLVYRPNQAWQFHGRLGTGYGTPQASNLFVTPQGTFGNNTQLKTQRNIGVDLGADLSLSSNLSLSVAGSYEWFHNEFVSQSPGVNLQNYTFNAPASAHRGMQVGVNARPLPGTLRGVRFLASYLLDAQVYSNYSELLTAGTSAVTFNRAGNRIPGVIPNSFNGRVIYDQPSGRLAGFGGYFETNLRDGYSMDNANLLKASGTTLFDLNLHYDPPVDHGWLSRIHFYYDLQNLASRTYIASANNITDSLNVTTGMENGPGTLANNTGSIWAGVPRASFGGFRVKF